MTSADNTFLNNVRKALGKKTSDVSDPRLFSPRPAGELKTLLTQADRTRKQRLTLLDKLKQASTPLNLSVHEAKTLDAAAGIIIELARQTDTEWGEAKQIMTHATPLMDDLDLTARLAEHSISVMTTSLQQDEDKATGRERLRREVEASYIGITGVDWCVADCAAIALLAGPGKERSTSLVPSVHIAVVMLDQILADLPELYAQLENLEELPTAFNFISGPSKTGDIEAQLVHGAHGPREMHLIVVTG